MSFQRTLRKLEDAPLRIMKWRILSEHHELWSERTVEILHEERITAHARRDFSKVQRLSSLITQFAQYRGRGLEEGFWGVSLDENRRAALDAEIPKRLINAVSMADELMKSNSWGEAVRTLMELRDGWDDMDCEIARAEVQLKLGNLLGDFGRQKHAEKMELAIKLHKAALEIYDREGLPEPRARVQYYMARTCWNLIHGNRAENLEKSIALGECALDIYTRANFPESWAKTVTNLAQAYWIRLRGDRMENLEKAIELSGSALDVYAPESFPEDWARIQTNLATAYSDRIKGNRSENIEKSLDLNESALKIYTRASYPESWALAMNNQAIVYLTRIRGDRAENLEKAIAHFNSALEVRTREDFPVYWAQSRNNLANAVYYRILGDRSENIDRSIKLREPVLEVWTQEDFPTYWGQTLNNLAAAYSNRINGDRAENLDKSIELYRKMSEVITRDAFPVYWAHTQHNMALSYSERRTGDRAGNLEKTIELLESALDIFGKNEWPVFRAMAQKSLAEVYTDRIRGDRAENLERAIALCSSALEVRKPEVFPRECRDTAMLLAAAQIAAGQWETALKSSELARDAVRILEQQVTTVRGKAQEIEESAVLFYHASYAEAHLGNITAAVEWLEQGRARELGEALTRTRALFEKILQDEDRREYSRIIENLAILEAEQRGAVPGARSFFEVVGDSKRLHSELGRLIARIQEYAPTFLDDTPVMEADIEELLENDRTAHILFNVTRFGTVVTVIFRVEEKLVIEKFVLDDFTVSSMEEMAEDWSQALERMKRGGTADETAAVCGRLYEDLFSPVHDWLSVNGLKIDRIVFVPHLALHNLPFHLLRYPSNGDTRYLLEDYEISYAPGLAMVLGRKGVHERERRSIFDRTPVPGEEPSSSKVLIVANPTLNLLCSEDEADYISEVFPGGGETLKGRDATRERFLRASQGAEILHLSCHGLFDFEDPWNSGLVLASDEMIHSGIVEESVEPVRTRSVKGRLFSRTFSNRDGSEQRIDYDAGGDVTAKIRSLPDGRRYLDGEGEILTMKEIVEKMDLRAAELVVLSACETGLVGYGGRADEFVGLPGGFFRAGVHNVVASLWAVDDSATASLMAEFYRGMFRENLQPASALRQAQLKFVSSGYWREKPYFWGAFRVLGV